MRPSLLFPVLMAACFTEPDIGWTESATCTYTAVAHVDADDASIGFSANEALRSADFATTQPATSVADEVVGLIPDPTLSITHTFTLAGTPQHVVFDDVTSDPLLAGCPIGDGFVIPATLTLEVRLPEGGATSTWQGEVWASAADPASMSVELTRTSSQVDPSLPALLEPAFPYDDCDEVDWHASAKTGWRYAPWSEMRRMASITTWACHQSHTVARWRAADYPPSPSTIE